MAGFSVLVVPAEFAAHLGAAIKCRGHFLSHRHCSLECQSSRSRQTLAGQPADLPIAAARTAALLAGLAAQDTSSCLGALVDDPQRHPGAVQCGNFCLREVRKYS